MTKQKTIYQNYIMIEFLHEVDNKEASITFRIHKTNGTDWELWEMDDPQFILADLGINWEDNDMGLYRQFKELEKGGLL